MRKLWLFLLLLYTLSGYGQSDVIDRTYGEDGKVEILIEDSLYIVYFFDVDSQGQIFNTSLTASFDYDQNVRWLPIISKWDSQGKRCNSFDDMLIDTTLEFGPRSYGHIRLSKDKVFKYYADTLDRDTIHLLSRFDMEFNLEATYNIDFGRPEDLLYFDTPVLDNSLRLFNVRQDSINRYLPDGSLDESFGEKGYVLLKKSSDDDFKNSTSSNSWLKPFGDDLLVNTSVQDKIERIENLFRCRENTLRFRYFTN